MERVGDEPTEGDAPTVAAPPGAPPVLVSVPRIGRRLPLRPLMVVLGFTLGLLILCNLQPREVPLWVSMLAYGVPILGAALLVRTVARCADYPEPAERWLTLFLLTCYSLSIGALFLAMARSDYATALQLNWGVMNGYLIIWLPVGLILPTIVAAMYVISMVSPKRRPLPYAAVLLSVVLFIVVLMPVPMSLSGDEVPQEVLPSPNDQNENALVVQPLWQYYLVTTDIGFIGIVIQMGAGVASLGLGGLWSLVRPGDFRRAFAMSVPAGPAEGPAPEQATPQLRLYG